MELEEFFEDNTEEKDVSIDFKRYLHGIFKRKWIVLTIFLVLTIPWLLFLKKQLPEYEAFTWIRFKNYDPQELRLINDSRNIELTSRTFAEKVVAQLGLTLELLEKDKKDGLSRQDIFIKFFTGSNPVPNEYTLNFTDNNSSYSLSLLNDNKDKIVIKTGAIAEIIKDTISINGFSFQLNPSFPKNNKQIIFSIKNFRSTVKWFQSSINLSMDQGGALMKLSMVFGDPFIVSQMVNELANTFIQESKLFENNKENEFKNALLNRLQASEVQLKKDQEALRIFQESHIFVNLDTDIQKKVTKLSQLESQRKDVKDNLKLLDALVDKLKTQGKEIIPGKEESDIRYIYQEIIKNPLFQQDANFGILSQRLIDTENRRQKKLEVVPITHPDIIKLDEQIISIHDKIYKNSIEQSKKTKNDILNLETEISKFENEIRRLPNEQMKLANLTQKVDVSQKMYTSLLTKVQEIEISDGVKMKEIDILDPAIPPEYPMNRNKRKNAALGAFFSFFLGLGVAVFLEFMDKTVKTPDDIKKYLKLNVIGTIPKIEFDNEFEMKDAEKLKQIDSQLVTYDYSPTPIGEAYRALRTKIVFSKSTGKIRTLVISSFAPGDGKSFTSANLAVTLAQHKTNTLLIDSDLRRGVLHNTFGIKKEPGFSNFLMGMARFEDIIRETYVPNLSLISCGSMMPNPSELLGSIQLKRFIEEAKRRYDIVLFDSPPLNAATDSVVLGTQSDGLVLIVRADVTNRNVAKQKLDLFENVPTNLIGVILNGTDAELAHEGYSYYHY